MKLIMSSMEMRKLAAKLRAISGPIGASRIGQVGAKGRPQQGHHPSQHRQSPVMITWTARPVALLRSRIDHLALQKQQLEMALRRLAASRHALKKLRAAVDRLSTDAQTGEQEQ